MWQRLGGSPFINADVKISAILMCFERFPVILSASCRYAVNYLCTFPRIRLCSMYFIANFAGAIYEDSFCLLDARVSLITLQNLVSY